MKRLHTIIISHLGLVFVSIMGLQDIQAQQSFYDIPVKSINGFDYDLGQLKGKKVLVVSKPSAWYM